MAEKSCTLTLMEKGETISSVTTQPGGDEIWVGRSHQCELRCRPDDLTVSGRHARIFWDGEDLWLEDGGSRNGIFHNGERVEVAHKLLAGELLTLGDCTLVRTDAKDVRPMSAAFCHRLEHRSGKRTGERVKILPDAEGRPFSIGSDEGCAIRLADEFIAPRHCHFELKDSGECWIYDDGGVNGTVVNGQVLHRKGRLLKDGDVVSVAQFDFCFLDRSTPHRRFAFALKLAAAVFTVIALGTGYVVHSVLSDGASVRIARARGTAAKGDFDGALAILDEARAGREGGKYAASIAFLRQQVENWKQTSGEWNATLDLLADGRFEGARKRLEPLLCATADNWTWNGDSGLDARACAERTQKTLRLYFDAANAAQSRWDGQPERGIARVEEMRRAVGNYLAKDAVELAKNASLTNLIGSLRTLDGDLKEIGRGFEEVDSEIAKLGVTNALPDAASVQARLKAMSNDPKRPAAVRTYAEKYERPCAGFAAVLQQLKAARQRVVNADFSQTQEGEIVLPPADLCARHKQFSDLRRDVKGYFAEVERVGRALGPMVRSVRAAEATLARIEDAAVWDAALGEDVFSLPLPRSRRQKPTGAYDALFCIEFAYDAIRVLPREYDGSALRFVGFTPTLALAHDGYLQVRFFMSFVEKGPGWAKDGEIARLYAACRRHEQARADLVRRLSATEGAARTRLAAWFAANYLADGNPPVPPTRIADLRKALKLEVAAAAEKEPSRILGLALPGDPFAHDEWVRRAGRSNAGGEGTRR